MRGIYLKRHPAVSWLLLGSMIFTGCAGTSESGTAQTQEGSSNPPFVTPGESVIDLAPETTQSAAETVDISVPVSTQAPTESESADASLPSASGHVVVLDPGHGGVYVGALDGSYQEKDLALRTAFYCRDYLVNRYEDVTVYLTRDTDKEFSVNEKVDLEERVRLASEYNADVLVSLHFNSEPSDTTNGSLVCVSKQPWVAEESAALGTSILEQLTQLGLADLGLMRRDSDQYFDEYGAALDYYAICRHSAAVGIPGVIVEHCFMRNATDRPYYSTEEALQRLGQADAVGIAQYLGLSEKE